MSSYRPSNSHFRGTITKSPWNPMTRVITSADRSPMQRQRLKVKVGSTRSHHLGQEFSFSMVKPKFSVYVRVRRISRVGLAAPTSCNVHRPIRDAPFFPEPPIVDPRAPGAAAIAAIIMPSFSNSQSKPPLYRSTWRLSHPSHQAAVNPYLHASPIPSDIVPSTLPCKYTEILNHHSKFSPARISECKTSTIAIASKLAFTIAFPPLSNRPFRAHFFGPRRHHFFPS